MARFDVYRIEGLPHYVVDLQAELLRDLSTRVVVPLVKMGEMEREVAMRLRPCLRVDGADWILNTPELAVVPCTRLSERVANLEDQRDVIVDAIDFLMQGY
ncbi:CcdB family protein [Hyphomicrobium sp.]|uniref:CcdB family protein n=1 Tax=Hyphomicrobium sp. TaxID=82 RepID=UPI002E36E350|nr:CcdB family protein [Hyphomicrobium sp.]HEX2839930.1 CcdB family protein [Hyphomicrobium sp.]